MQYNNYSHNSDTNEIILHNVLHIVRERCVIDISESEQSLFSLNNKIYFTVKEF